MAHRVVGIDVGFATLRAAQVRHASSAEAEVEKLVEISLPEGVIEAGEVVDRAALTKLLVDLWKQAGFKTRKVVVAAGSLHVFARELTVPLMSMQRIRESLPFMMEGILPVEPNQLFLDFYPAEDTHDETGPAIRGLAVAAERASVDSLVDCLMAARLRPIAVDFVPFALLRVHKIPKDKNQLQALIDIGAGATNVVITKGGIPLFVRVIPVGGLDVDHALMIDLKLSEAEAHSLKTKVKFDSKNKDEVEALTSIERVIGDFVAGIKNTLDYFEQSHDESGRKVGQLILSGGGAKLTGLADALAKVVDLPVIIDGDVHQIKTSSKLGASDEKIRRFALAIGLAIGGSH
ncbi:type IV pilus assembly protein PilM [Rhodoluna limnophila]|uniref:type IV pilus assembly protein PilM n=1 Tax=Rhodoluna limnophila TaxID=232537 RepID=UPI00156213DF|nr:type IV pilus assembly protein PilM [Rhodoluna limnophila]